MAQCSFVRQVDAFVRYLREQIVSSILFLSDPVDLLRHSPLIVGHFASNQSSNALTFVKVANLLRDQCQFAVLGTNSSSSSDVVYHLSNVGARVDLGEDWLDEASKFYQWADEKCSSSVRELTFANAEELTAEGLPFLLLFHRKDDRQSLQRFTERVERELLHQRSETTNRK